MCQWNAMSVWSFGGLWSQMINRIDCDTIFDTVPCCLVSLGPRTCPRPTADTKADTAASLTELIVKKYAVPALIVIVNVIFEFPCCCYVLT